jgi:4,5-dihydroxyphthalate decarboxylase
MTLSLTLACGVYDRTLPLWDGSVRPDGIELTCLTMDHGALFRRQARYAEFDVSEFSLGTYAILLARGDRRLVAIPVFPSRMFRHAYIFVHTEAGIREPRDLIGKRFGTMEYQQTAAVWLRGILRHEYGVAPDQVIWYFGGYDAPERYTERVPITLPPGLRVERLSDTQCLSQMLADGEIEALMGARPPRSFREGVPTVARLFPDPQAVELAYFRKTGIFPIMHTVVIKREIYERHPWVAVSLYEAFLRAQAVGWQRLHLANAIYCQMPWLLLQLEEQRALLGENIFTYTLETNRGVLATFLQYLWEDGLLERPLTPEELFVPETHEAPTDLRPVTWAAPGS